MHGVGEKLANKIWEIVESGELRKLDELSSTEEMKVARFHSSLYSVRISHLQVVIEFYQKSSLITWPFVVTAYNFQIDLVICYYILILGN